MVVMQRVSTFVVDNRIRFFKFCLVGGSGALLQLGLTYLLTEVGHIYYMLSLTIVIGITTVWNFTLNALWTFRRQK